MPLWEAKDGGAGVEPLNCRDFDSLLDLVPVGYSPAPER
jgi:hypothetical protein